MMRRDKDKTNMSSDTSFVNDYDCPEGYFTYRPLSNLPTPPPSTRNSSAAQSPRTTLDDGEPLMPRFRGIFHCHPSGTTSSSLTIQAPPFTSSTSSPHQPPWPPPPSLSSKLFSAAQTSPSRPSPSQSAFSTVLTPASLDAGVSRVLSSPITSPPPPSDTLSLRVHSSSLISYTSIPSAPSSSFSPL